MLSRELYRFDIVPTYPAATSSITSAVYDLALDSRVEQVKANMLLSFGEECDSVSLFVSWLLVESM